MTFKKFPKYPEKDSYLQAYLGAVSEWRKDTSKKLEKRLEPIEKAIKDIHSRDESTWGIGTSINLGVLHDKASLLRELLEALK